MPPPLLPVGFSAEKAKVLTFGFALDLQSGDPISDLSSQGEGMQFEVQIPIPKEMKKCKYRGTCFRIGILNTYHCIIGVLCRDKLKTAFISAAYYVTNVLIPDPDPVAQTLVVHRSLNLIPKYILSSDLPKPGEDYDNKSGFHVYRADMNEYMQTLNNLLNDKEVILPEKKELDQFLNLIKEIRNEGNSAQTRVTGPKT